MMRSVVNFLTGALIGAFVGAMLALLLAPYSGDELRYQIQERAKTIQEEVKQASADRRAELEAQLTALRSPQKPSGAE